MTRAKRQRPIGQSSRAGLALLRARLPESRLRALFADIRANPDHVLLGADQPPRTPDGLVEAVRALLAPSPGNSAAKARALVGELERLTGRALPIAPRGLPDAVRRLRSYLSDDDIRDGAFSLRIGFAETAARREKGSQ